VRAAARRHGLVRGAVAPCIRLWNLNSPGLLTDDPEKGEDIP
jgi:hypothetical protein